MRITAATFQTHLRPFFMCNCKDIVKKKNKSYYTNFNENKLQQVTPPQTNGLSLHPILRSFVIHFHKTIISPFPTIPHQVGTKKEKLTWRQPAPVTLVISFIFPRVEKLGDERGAGSVNPKLILPVVVIFYVGILFSLFIVFTAFTFGPF